MSMICMGSVVLWLAVPIFGAEDWEQIQCGDTEAALHEQGQ